MATQLHHRDRARFLGGLRSLAVAGAAPFAPTLLSGADTAWSTRRCCSAVRNVLPPYTQDGLAQTHRLDASWRFGSGAPIGGSALALASRWGMQQELSAACCGSTLWPRINPDQGC